MSFLSELWFQYCHHHFSPMAVEGLSLFYYRIPLLLKWKEGAHCNPQNNILSVRESTLPTSLNFSEHSVQMEHKFSRTPNRFGKREDQSIVSISQDRLGFGA